MSSRSIHYHEHNAVAEAADNWQVRHITFQDPPGQVRVWGMLLLIINGGVRGDDTKPHKHSKDLMPCSKRWTWIMWWVATVSNRRSRDICSFTHLDRDEGEGDEKLGGWANEFGWSHWLLALFEDAVDAIGFGQHGRVGDSHAKAQKQATECTNHHTWLRNHQKGDQVDQEDTCRKTEARVITSDWILVKVLLKSGYILV